MNVEPDLEHLRRDHRPAASRRRALGVTSLVDLGLPVTMDDLDAALRRALPVLEAALPRTEVASAVP